MFESCTSSLIRKNEAPKPRPAPTKRAVSRPKKPPEEEDGFADAEGGTGGLVTAVEKRLNRSLMAINGSPQER